MNLCVPGPQLARRVSVLELVRVEGRACALQLRMCRLTLNLCLCQGEIMADYSPRTARWCDAVLSAARWHSPGAMRALAKP